MLYRPIFIAVSYAAEAVLTIQALVAGHLASFHLPAFTAFLVLNSAQRFLFAAAMGFRPGRTHRPFLNRRCLLGLVEHEKFNPAEFEVYKAFSLALLASHKRPMLEAIVEQRHARPAGA
jgi:hypothetical protein